MAIEQVMEVAVVQLCTADLVIASRARVEHKLFSSHRLNQETYGTQVILR